jgi:hypothetical protein
MAYEVVVLRLVPVARVVLYEVVPLVVVEREVPVANVVVYVVVVLKEVVVENAVEVPRLVT